MRRGYPRTLVVLPDDPAVTTERLGRIGPPVCAIVVAHDPGDWFEETLASLRDQDYSALSVTVVDAATERGRAETAHSELVQRVAALLPAANVITAEGSAGFGPAVNAAARVILGHAQPGAREARATPTAIARSADGGDAAFLLICGDDVALAPNAVAVLVDEAVRRRAAVAGPKLVDWDNSGFLQCVGLSADRMGVPVPLVTEGEYDQGQHDEIKSVLAVPSACMLIRARAFSRLGGFDGSMNFYGEDLDLCRRTNLAGETVLVVPTARVRRLSRQSGRRQRRDPERLAFRHQLRSVLVCTRASRLAGELVLLIALTTLEAALALLTGHFRRASALIGAWLWNLLGLAGILGRRRLLRDSPGFTQTDRLTYRGYVSLTRFAGRLLRSDAAIEGTGVLWGRRRRLRDAARDTSFQGAAAAWIIIGVIFIFGSRHLLTRGIPIFGEISLLGDSPGELFAAWTSNWREAGLGSDGPSPTANAILGFAGSLLLGAMGLTRTVLLLGLVPFGAVGLWRLLATTGSRRAQIVGVVAFFAMPLPYNALANGVWSALAIYGTLPWLCLWLARVLGPVGANETAPTASIWVSTLMTGILLALVSAFVPVAPVMLLLLVAALLLGGLLVGSTRRVLPLLATAAGGLVVAWLLNWPAAPTSLAELFSSARARPSSASGLSLAEMFRFASGSALASSLVWGLVAVAAIALFVARETRFVWVVRAWCLMLASLLLALAAEHDWSPWDLPRPEVLLAPAAFGVALAIAVGSAEGSVVRGGERSRRWLLTMAGLAALIVGSVPALALTLDGRWGTPRGDFRTSLAEVEAESRLGAFRILWVGHSDVLPVGGWALADGLVFATSTSVPPEVGLQWPGSRPPEAKRLRNIWLDAMAGRTDHMGERLASLGVRYVVVMERIAPEPFGDLVAPVPPRVHERLGTQFDLERRESRGGVSVFRNISWRPSRLLLAGTGEVTSAEVAAATTLALPNFEPPATARGTLPAESTLYLADAAEDWVLYVGGSRVEPEPALGWAQSFSTGSGGEAVLRHESSAANVRRPILWALAVTLALLAALRRRIAGSPATAEDSERRRAADRVVSALLARARRGS